MLNFRKINAALNLSQKGLAFYLPVFCILICISQQAMAQKKSNGRFSLGYWSVNQDTLDQENALENDGVGNDYLQEQYKSLLLSARYYQKKIFEDSNKQHNLYFNAKARFNLGENNYTLAYNEKQRYEIADMAIEMKKAFAQNDVWLGRQTVFEAGGIRFDGLRLVFHSRKNIRTGLFFGLGQDPRSSVGYIGENYQEKLINPDFLSFGTYVSYRHEKGSMDLALNTQLFQSKIDRMYTFIQATYQPNSDWFFSTLLNVALVPVSLDHVLLTARYQIKPAVRNTLSFTRWSNIEYAESQSSQIPLNGRAGPSSYINGDDFNDSHYTQIKDQVHVKFLRHHSSFIGFDYSKRSFDDLNRKRFFLGYHNSRLFNANTDFDIQAGVMDNYKSAHTSLDINLGREFLEGKFRLEGSYSSIKTERDIYINNEAQDFPTENEREHSFGLSTFFYLNKGSLVHAQYQIFKEEDSLNDGDPITLQELYVGTNFRF